MTYSIVARDPETGEMGVAVQTAVPFVGATCPWAEAGIGVVSTQAMSRKSHGSSILTLMRNGHSAKEALDAVITGDPDADVRQVGALDVNGVAHAHTGAHTIRFAGHVIGENFAMQANMMLDDTVPDAMAEAFQKTEGALVLRILAALDAAQAEGGDFRGQQSAALKIVSGELPKNDWEGVWYDVRVDDHTAPLQELRRLVMHHMAYHASDEVIKLARADDMEAALAKFDEIPLMDPNTSQIQFFTLLELADMTGTVEAVEARLRPVFAHEPMWVECLRRVAEARPLKTEGLLEQILVLAE